jgi:hypothetical protein
MRPPTRINLAEKTFYGKSYRSIGIALVAIALGAVTFLSLRQTSLPFGAGLAVLFVGLGLALAFGQIDGKTPESWFLDLISFKRRRRVMVHRAARQPEATPEVVLPSKPARAKPEPAKSGTPASAPLARQPSFFFLAADAVGLALVTGLALWLFQGGADQLKGMFHGL